MRKSLIVLGALALVLTIVAGAGAAKQALLPGSQLENDSVTGAKIHDRSLHFIDFTASGESMIRQGWRLATGKDKVQETMLDPALLARLNANDQAYLDTLPRGKTMLGLIEAREDAANDDDALWSGVRYRLPVSGSYAGHVLQNNQKTTECNGTYAAPSAAAGHLCVYLGTSSANTGDYAMTPIAGVGFRFTWKADHAGLTSVDATYAFTQS